MLVFHHPKPSWPAHLLLVPKRPIPSLLHLTRLENELVLSDVIAAAQVARERLGLKAEETVLCANGGPRQDVGQLHFHLFTGEEYISPHVTWELHRVIVGDVRRELGPLVKQSDLETKGHTLVIQMDGAQPVFHVIAGRRLSQRQP